MPETSASSLDVSKTPAMLAGARFTWFALAVVLVAMAWRIALAVAMPCIARDGVLYCWFARDLGEFGHEVVHEGVYDQHPLYSLAMLCAQRALRAAGVQDGPLLWQASGQAVAIFAGAALVALSGCVAYRLTALVRPAVAPRFAALLAMALAAVLPLGTLLSAQVMSDTLHAALYLGAVLCMLGPLSIGAAFGCGALSGLAFVTRPEGLSVALVAFVAMIFMRPRQTIAHVGVRLAALVVGVLLTAGPYWLALGEFSTKLDKQTVEEFVPARFDVPTPPQAAPVDAALIRRDVSWVTTLPLSTYELLRAGRLIVPLLAIAPLYVLRRRLFQLPVIVVLGCLALHFALVNALLVRHGYLAPRHLFVMVQLLLPLAAIELAGLHGQLATARRTAVLIAVYIVCFAPYVAYSTRVPNGADAPLRQLAERLVSRAGRGNDRLLLGGASERRIAFYAEIRFQPWPENEVDPDERLEALRSHLFDASGPFRPDFLAITVGGGGETSGNQHLLDKLLALPAGATLRLEDEQVGFTGARVLLYRRGGAPPPSASAADSP